MPVLRDGAQIDYKFSTSRGAMGAIAMISIQDDILELRDAALYPTLGDRLDLGARAMLEVTRHLEQFAAMENFARVTVTGHRLSGATPGRPLYLDRRIR